MPEAAPAAAPVASAPTNGAPTGTPQTPAGAPKPGAGKANIGDIAKDAAAGTQAPPTPVKVKVKYKDDGKDFEEELSEEDIATRARQARWAQRSAAETAKLRKENEEIAAKLRDRKTFWEMAKQLGHDPDALAEERVVQKYTPQTMTPEQLREYQLQQQAEQYKNELDQYKSKEQKAAEDREAQTFMRHIDGTLGEIAKLDIVPKNPRMLARLADVWEPLHENGYQPTPQELGSAVFETLKEDFHGLRGQRSGDQLLTLVERLMGEDVGKELSKAYLARWKSRSGAPQAQPVRHQARGDEPASRQPNPGRKPGESFDEYFDRLHGGK